MLTSGGVLMVPISFCSVLALGIVLERLFNLRHRRIVRMDILQRVEELLREKKIHEATTLCKRYQSAMTRILYAAILNHDLDKTEIKEIIEDAGRQEVPSLERYLSILGTIANISPLLGLLGTVLGIMKVFLQITTQGVGHPQAMAGGISEALITTAAGLTVAIPALVFHSYFMNKANLLILEMEKNALKMLNILKR